MTLLGTLMQIINEEWNNLKITFAEPWEIPWIVPANERDDYEIYLLEKGKGRFIISGAEYPVSKGDIMFFHTKEENLFVADESPIRFVFVTFKIDNPKNTQKIATLNNLLLRENNPIRLDDPQCVQEFLYQMQKEICIKSDEYMFKLKLLLGNMISKLIDQYKGNKAEGIKLSPNRNAHECINYIIIYLQNNYNRNISLYELGKLVNLHPRYLCTLFRQVSGKTINELLREIRIEKAKRLLLYTSLSITEIAMEVGFSDSQYFSRIFNLYEKTAPTAFRKNKHTKI